LKELRLVPAAFLQLVIARLKVSFLPAGKYLPVTDNNPPSAISVQQFKSVKNIATVVNGLAARTPWPSTCLVKVVAGHKMLSKKNIPHTLHLGVKKTPAGEMKAHAWLSVANKIIIGGASAGEFREISQINIRG
jgi:hypothetical protein